MHRTEQLKPAPHRRPNRYTQGATLIVVVIFTLLVLSLMLAATLRLSLNTRLASTDQKAILQTQYNAESNLALMRSQIRNTQTLLSQGSVGVPSGTTKDTIGAMALALCGSGATWSTIPATTTEFSAPRNINGNAEDKVLYLAPQQCSVNIGNSANQYQLLAYVLSNTAYATNFPVSEAPTAYDMASLQTWWLNHIYPTQTIGSAQYNFKPIRVIKLNQTAYRVYFAINNISVSSDASAKLGKRVVSGSSTNAAAWWLQIELPTLTPNILVTNHQRSARNNTLGAAPDVYFSGSQTFDGPVFTNESFLFNNDASTQFKGQVSSAGCTDLPTTGPNSSGSCQSTPSVYVGSPTLSYTGSNTYLSSSIINNTSGVNFNNIVPNFNASYKALPTNSTDQKTLATPQSQNGGLTIPSFDKGVYMFAGDSNGNTLGTYNTTTNSWNEPSPTYQYIYMQDFLGNPDPFNMYRIDSSGNIYKKSGLFWGTAPVGQKFNGVIYSSSNRPINISGPPRLNNDTTGNLKYSVPALASFSNMSITAANGINITTDLTISNSPCSNSQYANGSCPNSKMTSQAALGLFTPTGDITIDSGAPNNINLHAALMASTGQVTVTGYDSGGSKGTANVTGSVIENWYGPFGTSGTACTAVNRYNQCVSTAPSTTGYSRNFSADPRFGAGLSPRGFPTATNWSATDASISNVSLDNIIWKQATQ